MSSHDMHEHHEKAAEHHEHAAKHHREATKHAKAGDHEKSAHHSHAAHGHALHAHEHHGHASKMHAERHGGFKRVAASGGELPEAAPYRNHLRAWVIPGSSCVTQDGFRYELPITFD